MVTIADGPRQHSKPSPKNVCPWCSKKPELVERGGGHRRFTRVPFEYRVGCQNPLCHIRPTTQWYFEADVAVEAWDKPLNAKANGGTHQ